MKTALLEMFYGKCAYCESKVNIVAYGEIEHFRPKGDPVYEHLTFEWNNLLYSCNVCNNGKHKGTKFPLNANNEPLLIDPTDDINDPFLYLNFVWDDAAKLANIDGLDERGNTVTDIFDLNGIRGRKELIQKRSLYIKKLLSLLDIAVKTTDLQSRTAAIKMLKDSCQLSEEYSAFALVYILPHLAHHFRDVEAIALLKKVSQRSPAYAKISRVNQL